MDVNKRVAGEAKISNRRYFHTFDALRFFAFFKVFLLHIPIAAFPWFNFVKAGGGIGVQFFFVLSGFLITYIILEEKERTGSLNLKNFFIRRVLRIWPLYYLMVFVAYATPYILSHLLHISSSAEGYEPQLWVSLTFLENYKMMITQQHANVSPLSIMWSLCIEEHFYVIWGLLLYFMCIKHLPKLIIGSLFVSLLARAVFFQYDLAAGDLLTNIDLFAFGAIPAYLLIKRPEFINSNIGAVSKKGKQLLVTLIIIIVTICSQYAGDDRAYIFLTTLLGAVFSLLILLTLPQKSPIKIKNENILSKMGVYTYGLYLYHILIINLLRQVFNTKGWDINTAKWGGLLFIMSIALSLLCSVLSYHLFEKHFLKLKRYFK